MTADFCPFVYGLFDPGEPGHVRYVGMAVVRASRPYEHAKWARKPSTKPSHFVHWLRKLENEGRQYDVIVLEQLAVGASANFLGFVERCYIASLRSIGHRLTNVADGGNGGNLGPEANRKNSLAKIGNKATLGFKFSLEQRAKISASLMGRRHAQTSETRAKISASKMNHPVSDVTRSKIKDALRKSWAKRKIQS